MLYPAFSVGKREVSRRDNQIKQIFMKTQTDLEQLIAEAEAANLPYDSLDPIQTIIGYMTLFDISLDEIREAYEDSCK